MNEADTGMEEDEEEKDLKLVEEYTEKMDEMKDEITEKEKLIRNLRSENEILLKQSENESKMLESKAQELEKLRRTNKRMEKENIKLQKKVRTIPMHSKKPVEDKKQPNKSYSRRNTLHKIMDNGRKLRATKGDFMSNELEKSVQNFNEMFINNLSFSLTQIFVNKNEDGEEIVTTNIEEKKDDQDTDEDEEEEIDMMDEDDEIQDEYDIQDMDPVESSPKKEEVDEVLNESEVDKTQNIEMQEQINEHEQAVFKIEGTLKEREKLLEAVKESHSMMQNNLLDEMKKEYHQKVSELELDI